MPRAFPRHRPQAETLGKVTVDHLLAERMGWDEETIEDFWVMLDFRAKALRQRITRQPTGRRSVSTDSPVTLSLFDGV